MKHHDVVQLLVAAGADIEAKSSDQSTALHLACDQNDPVCVFLLLRLGANARALTVREQLPWHIAEKNRCFPVMRLLRCYDMPFEPRKRDFAMLPRGTRIRMRTVALCHAQIRLKVWMTSSFDDDGVWLRDVCFGDLHYWLVGEICAWLWLLERETPLLG